MSVLTRLKSAFSAFRAGEQSGGYFSIGPGSTRKPDRIRLEIQNERTIVASAYTRIAADVAAIKIRHIRQDENGRFLEEIDSSLNDLLTFAPNLDQTGRSFIEDLVLSLFDEGVVAVVPVRCDISPENNGSFQIHELRTGQILEWFPEHIRVKAYNQKTGQREEFLISKRVAAIIENPFYSVMNERNSTLQRLTNKLNFLDAIDRQNSSGKLDLIIQLPYTVNNQLKQDRAEQRLQSIESQLNNSAHGIVYIDGTEKVTQLNRPVENNLMAQVEYLTKMFYNQLGITEEVFNGTADEAAMLNYNNRTIEPIISAITDAMTVKFLTKTARTQGQRISFFTDPFRLVPVANLAEIVDKFTRNEILTSNEIRAIIGYKPSKDPRANELRNKNLNASESDQLLSSLPNETPEKLTDPSN